MRHQSSATILECLLVLVTLTHSGVDLRSSFFLRFLLFFITSGTAN
jgi:hypothetical protein